MQFQFITVIVQLAALMPSVLAAPSFQALAPRASSACFYETATYTSVCEQGDTLFCTGNINICPSGKTDTLDAKANSANVASCKGLGAIELCTQTVACC